MKKKVIVTGGTKSDVAPIAVFALNIKDTNSHLFDKLIVFHDGIKKADQDRIKAIIDTEFINYQFPYRLQNDIIINYFSPMLFCKYECFRMLQEYDVVVWSDYDVLIQGSLDDVCNFRDASINIVVDGKRKIRDMFYRDIQNKEIYAYDLDKEGLCTPLFSVSSQIGNYMEMYRWCYQKTLEYDKDLMLAEQCIFSLVLQKYTKKYNIIDAQKYACHPKDAQGNEIILHSYGQPKFWNGLNNEKWNDYYAVWIEKKGTPYSDRKKKAKSLCRLFISRIKGIKAKE